MIHFDLHHQIRFQGIQLPIISVEQDISHDLK